MQVNITIGRFLPFTKGHLNMIVEGGLPCIVYRINSSKNDEEFSKIKIKGKIVKPLSIKNVIQYLDNPGSIELNETEKELLKRPFTNNLIEEELELIKKHNKKYFVDVVYVKNAYEALADFNKKVFNKDYEPKYLMCGDDRVDNYKTLINTYDSFKTPDGKETKNVLKNTLEPNIGKGRTKGISGTAVRLSIILKDKLTFSSIMPAGVDIMFSHFIEAFNNFKLKLQQSIKESSINLKDYIKESLLKENFFGNIGIGKTVMIENWLKEMGIKHYNINEDLTIDVNSTVNLIGKNLTELPHYILFNYAESFFIDCNPITTLRGCPKKTNWFSCRNCKNLTTLEGAPEKVVLVFDCSDCTNLISLEDAPKKSCDNFFCCNCLNLKSLKYCTSKIKKKFSIVGCKGLDSLEGCPKEVGYFHCKECKINFTEEEVKKHCKVNYKIIN